MLGTVIRPFNRRSNLERSRPKGSTEGPLGTFSNFDEARLFSEGIRSLTTRPNIQPDSARAKNASDTVNILFKGKLVDPWTDEDDATGCCCTGTDVSPSPLSGGFGLDPGFAKHAVVLSWASLLDASYSVTLSHQRFPPGNHQAAPQRRCSFPATDTPLARLARVYGNPVRGQHLSQVPAQIASTLFSVIRTPLLHLRSRKCLHCTARVDPPDRVAAFESCS
ncbi:hypothetical protein N7539_002874 [Penicillium diatomitis]|uniref:Uncharacterized protein n=1 Tax=Penicillium diatomitis TaxID=2819901 RepID=A0A9X0BZL6_9EURO|nr:uncharacterized protein N7539_002874 [Penicillium diatomitis]KAJ5491307.1 hypothetical protein N7539_002874 [Penicillium diatomitis]